jgi:hypothetical protein
LYPGHGLLTGTLRRSLHTEPAHLDGQRVSGAVGTAPLRYALKIHALYRYLLNGYDQVKGQAVSIISRRVRNG